MLSPTELSLRGRLGAFRLHSTHDPRLTTIPARRAFLQRFLDAIPADLPEDERRRRAEYALKAHMTKLAFNSARNRRLKAEARRAAVDQAVARFERTYVPRDEDGGAS